MRKEEVNNNNKKEKTLLSPLTIVMTDAPPEAQCLAKRSTAAGYIVIIVPASFGGQGKMRSYTHKQRGQSTISMVEAYSVGGGSLCRLPRQSQKV